MNLEQLQQIASGCNLCELFHGRKKPVFARGNPNSKIMICGMCPGPDENKIGSPFVGTAGKVLDEIIAYSNLEDVYITNLVKCFVQPGTSLKPEWVANCTPYLIVQLAILKPKIIVGLGADVCNFLVNRDLSNPHLDNQDQKIGQMRGKIHKATLGTKLVATYHPSYLARGGGSQHRQFQTVVNDFNLALNYI